MNAFAEVTVQGCNCLTSYNYTLAGTTSVLTVTNGSCIQTESTGLPWCLVDASTCIGAPSARDGYAADDCVVKGSACFLHTCHVLM
jgi:hypothetical protein